jgi:hypothetical protein
MVEDTNTYLSSTAATNFVDVTGDQSINGGKRFSNNILVREADRIFELLIGILDLVMLITFMVIRALRRIIRQ